MSTRKNARIVGRGQHPGPKFSEDTEPRFLVYFECTCTPMKERKSNYPFGNLDAGCIGHSVWMYESRYYADLAAEGGKDIILRDINGYFIKYEDYQDNTSDNWDNEGGHE